MPTLEMTIPGYWTIEYFPPSGENRSVITVDEVEDVKIWLDKMLPNAIVNIEDNGTKAVYVDHLNTGVAVVSKY